MTPSGSIAATPLGADSNSAWMYSSTAALSAMPGRVPWITTGDADHTHDHDVHAQPLQFLGVEATPGIEPGYTVLQTIVRRFGHCPNVPLCALKCLIILAYCCRSDARQNRRFLPFPFSRPD